MRYLGSLFGREIMKKRIGLFLGGDQQIGGAFQYNLAMLDACAGLPRERFEVVACYSNPGWRRYLQEHPLPAVFLPRDFLSRTLCKAARVGNIPMNWWRAVFPFVNPMARGMLRLRCDLWIFPTGDEWTYELPVPALTTIHDLMHRYERRFPEVSANGEYGRREKLLSLLCRYARGILVDSEVGKEHVQESYHLTPERIFVLPFVPPGYIFTPGDPAGLDERYHLPPKFIFYPANFWEHKNHRGLLLALAAVKNDIPDLRLVLGGALDHNGAAAQELAAELQLQENVLFPGYIADADMAAVYRRARALVMTTFFGPTNIPPLEAMALGCPVGVSDIYGMREQLGDAALYFDPAAPAEIARVLVRLWQDDALGATLKQRGLQRAAAWTRSHFSARLGEIIDAV
jgi:glycosyltransferase involved in cell wall biosynthesis